MRTSRQVHWWLYFQLIEKFVEVTTAQTLLFSVKPVYKHYNAKLRSDVSFFDSTSELETWNWANWRLLQKFVIDESSTFATTDRGIIGKTSASSIFKVQGLSVERNIIKSTQLRCVGKIKCRQCVSKLYIGKSFEILRRTAPLYDTAHGVNTAQLTKLVHFVKKCSPR